MGVALGRGGCGMRKGWVWHKGGVGVMRGKDECVTKEGWAWREGGVGSKVVRCLCVLR